MHELICRENTHCFYFLITARAACAGSAAYFHFPLIFLFFLMLFSCMKHIWSCARSKVNVFSLNCDEESSWLCEDIKSLF